MIKAYVYGDRTQLSPHFRSSEFQCKCGKAHDTLISDELVSKLEALQGKAPERAADFHRVQNVCAEEAVQ